MAPEQVEEKVIQLIHRKPFVPFVVEMTDGTMIEIPHPRLAINSGGAVFFGPDGGLVDLEFEHVRAPATNRRDGVMTPKQLERALQGFGQRRPFRRFLIELVSGGDILIVHPEAVRREDDLYVVRLPEGSHVVFSAGSVTRLLDPPAETRQQT